MNILVTGAAGFVGSNLCRRLVIEDHEVVGVDDLSCGFMRNLDSIIDEPNFRFLKHDISQMSYVNAMIANIEYMKPFDVIFHFAARGELYFCRDWPQRAIEVNVIGTLNMLKAAEELGCEHFIFSDTSAEYDAMPTYIIPQKESDSPGVYPPLGIYSISKMAASQYVRSWFEQEKFPVTILRYFNVYGPSINIERDIPPLIGGFAAKMIQRQRPIIYGSGEKRRDFIYVDDVTDFHMMLLEKKTIGQTYNVGTGINFSVNEMYEIISKIVLGGEEFWIEPEIRPDQPNEADLTLADISKARREYGWYPKVEIEEGVEKTVKSIEELMI